jgi:hypothetical protein
MEAISEAMVEETWVEVGQLPPEEAQNQVQGVWKRQPELMHFLMELTEDLSQGASELAFYLFFVVVRMFEKAYGSGLQEVMVEQIVESFEANQDFLERLARVNERFLEKLFEPDQWEQPYVLRYVVEALMEASESEEDPIELSEQEFGCLFLVLKTVIDSLNKASSGE